jgi:hypothetical protein
MHEEAVLEGAAHAIQMAKIIDRRTTRVDTGFQRLDEAQPQVLTLAASQLPSRTRWVDTRPEQGLISVDVADAGDQLLIEEHGLDRRAAAAHHRAQVRDRKVLVEGLKAQARREEIIKRLRADHELPRAEPACVGDHQTSRRQTPDPVDELHADAGVRRLCDGVVEQHPAHAQVLDEEDPII